MPQIIGHVGDKERKSRGPPRRWREATLYIERQARGQWKVDDYKIILYCQEDGPWVAEIPAISGCYALMPTREEALADLTRVFRMIAEEYREKGLPPPAHTTEIIHA